MSCNDKQLIAINKPGCYKYSTNPLPYAAFTYAYCDPMSKCAFTPQPLNMKRLVTTFLFIYLVSPGQLRVVRAVWRIVREKKPLEKLPAAPVGRLIYDQTTLRLICSSPAGKAVRGLHGKLSEWAGKFCRPGPADVLGTKGN